jgi:predicted transcriptional regulator
MSKDICENRHGGNEFSQAAKQVVEKHESSLRLRIIHHLFANGPATCEATANALGMRMSTASARFSELKARGRIVATGGQQQTTSGCWAAVYDIVRPGGPDGKRETTRASG